MNSEIIDHESDKEVDGFVIKILCNREGNKYFID